MPYIKKNNDRRTRLRKGEPAQNAGELNYQIFYYVKHQLENKDKIDSLIIQDDVDQFLGSKPNYQRYNDMTGCLVRCFLEIQRRLGIWTNIFFRDSILGKILYSYNDEIAKYEDKKIIENGDVE